MRYWFNITVFPYVSPEIGQFERKLLQKHGAKAWDFEVPVPSFRHMMHVELSRIGGQFQDEL